MTSPAKEALRERMREVRAALDPEAVSARSAQIEERLTSLAAFAHAHVVGCYLALPREVQTRGLVDRCRKLGKKVCVPARTQDGSYAMAWLDRDDETVPGPLGIRQPQAVRPAPQREIDLMIVPGVAFDRNARRLGHGGGHFDRLLAKCSAVKVGLAFEVQVVDEVPADPHDVAMDLVVTEEAIYPLAGRPARDAKTKR